jgi:uncharacterized membrane protein
MIRGAQIIAFGDLAGVPELLYHPVAVGAPDYLLYVGPAMLLARREPNVSRPTALTTYEIQEFITHGFDRCRRVRRVCHDSEEEAMFRRKKGASEVAGDALKNVSPYASQLTNDQKFWQMLVSALAAGVAAGQRAKRQAGVVGLAGRLGSDPVLRAQIAEAVVQLQKAGRRVKKRKSHRTRNVMLLLSSAGAVVAVVPNLRRWVTSKLRRLEWRRDTWTAHGITAPRTIEQEIEVEVPVSAAYNQWTQFEQFPSFMEGVDEVKQLDDTLLHWAATVAGRTAEWDAKIIEQEPDRRITWESIDGKQTRGTVTFEPGGAPSRTRIRLNMSYRPDTVTETVGSAVGLDERRVRGDLERFRELIEAQQVESGAWRGTIKEGQERTDETSDA